MKKYILLLLPVIYCQSFSQDYWQKMPVTASGFSYGSVNRLFITPADEIYLASDSGVQKSIDGGNTWINFPETFGSEFVYVSNSGTIYGGGYPIRDGYLKSDDEGETWDTVFTHTPYPDGYGLGAYSITVSEPNNVFVGLRNVDAIIKSNDNGASFALAFGDTVYSFGLWNFLATDGEGRIYGRQDFRYYAVVSSDNGETWDTLMVPGAAPPSGPLQIHGSYVSRNKVIFFVNGQSLIVKANDDGTELVEYIQLDTAIKTYSGVFCVREDSTIIVASGKDIYLSPDNGLTWKIETSGIDTLNEIPESNYVSNIQVDSRGFIYLYGPNGLYKSRTGLNGLGVNYIESSNLTSQLGIYDISGKKVSILKSEMTWDGRDTQGNFLNNGIYFLVKRNKPGSYETIKFVLNR